MNLCLSVAEKECLGTCVQNMQQSDDLSPLEIVEMFAGLSCFLKDSSDVSQTLLDDFRMCQGYAFLCDLMLRYRLRGRYQLPVCHCRASFQLLCVQTGTNQGGRIQRRLEGPGQPSDLSDHVWRDGAEACWTHHWRPLLAAWLCAPPAFGQRFVWSRTAFLLHSSFFPFHN